MSERKAAYIQVTRVCNNACVFCSNPQFEKNNTFEDSVKTIDQFSKEGITDIYLTGGEPTEVRYLPDLIEYANNKGLVVKIITNGVNISDKNLIKKYAEKGLKALNVSIHTLSEEDSIKLSGKAGHLEKTLQGIQNCIDLNLHISLNITLNSINCKYLSIFIDQLSNKFSKIGHYVFNNLDPGNPDGKIRSRAGENPWIVCKLTDLEIGLKEAIDVLKAKRKTFRIERVPLCYMSGFEEFSTETRKIVKGEEYVCSFIEEKSINQVRRVTPENLRVKLSVCKNCKLNSICGGVQEEYLKLYGTKEIYPRFEKPEDIIKKII